MAAQLHLAINVTCVFATNNLAELMAPAKDYGKMPPRRPGLPVTVVINAVHSTITAALAPHVTLTLRRQCARKSTS